MSLLRKSYTLLNMDPKDASSNPVKKRKNVMLTEDAIGKGQELKRLDRRGSFSNMLEALLNKEYLRRFPEKKEAAISKIAAVA